jgi:hypothetical protein
MIDVLKLHDVQVAGIDHRDHPDYCDAYIETAFITEPDGTVRELTESEIEEVNQDHEFILNCVMDHLC